MTDWIDREIELSSKAALALGRAERVGFPHAIAAAYSREHDLVVIDLENGSKFAFPPRLAQGLSTASRARLQDVRLTPGGYGLYWPKLDAALSVKGLLMGVFGGDAWASEWGAKGGRVKSTAKSAAARANGAKGGRPPSTKVERKLTTPG